MSLSQAFSTVYPQYRLAMRALRTIDLKTRSTFIKLCQAQSIPTSSDSNLSHMLDSLPPAYYYFDGNFKTAPPRDFFIDFQIDISDPVVSAIFLDICRGLPLEVPYIDEAKIQSWGTEIALANTSPRKSAVDWRPLFQKRYSHLPIHPDLPANAALANTIRQRLVGLMKNFHGRILFPRATHKNMSRETRRELESEMRQSLEDVPIVGQDDWCRFYHATGVKVSGSSEMRQKWYPSGAKPRTYFAMGGEAYQHSRHLQDFFTSLVDILPPTNHFSRLRPGRLYLPSQGSEWNFRIYDLSSFTSNFGEQRYFCQFLAEIARGVEVTIVDERDGPISCDLGDLLDQYNDFCVKSPALSLERWDPFLEGVQYNHLLASLLGIYGNLMTCTFCHYCIVAFAAPVDFDGINVAGDDGIIPEQLETEFQIDVAISLVGSYAREKSFRGDEEAVICLKRPFIQDRPFCSLMANIVPPTVSKAFFLLTGIQDPRYKELEMDISEGDAATIIGKDLMRFLSSAYRMKYDNVEELHRVYSGFCSLVQKVQGRRPSPNLYSFSSPAAFWPVDPLDYDFLSISPLGMLALYFSAPVSLPKYERLPLLDIKDLRYPLDVVECNSDERLVFLERLGYLEKEQILVSPSSHDELVRYWSERLDDTVSAFIPVVYRYTVVVEVPLHFLFAI